MKIQNYLAPTRNQIPGLPDDIGWIDRILAGRDKQLKTLTTAAQGRLSFEDNLNAETRQLSVRHDVPVTIRPQTIKGRVIAVLVLESDLYDYLRLKWRGVIDGVEVAVKFDSAPTDAVDVTFLLLGN